MYYVAIHACWMKGEESRHASHNAHEVLYHRFTSRGRSGHANAHFLRAVARGAHILAYARPPPRFTLLDGNNSFSTARYYFAAVSRYHIFEE